MTSVAMCVSGLHSCESSLLFGMISFSLVDAMTFPFVADAVMSMFDKQYKATTLATLYFIANIAASAGGALIEIFKPLPMGLICSMALLLLFSSIIQKYAEVNSRTDSSNRNI